MASAGQSTEQARQAQDVDAIPTLAWSARPDGSAEFLNRRWLDYLKPALTSPLLSEFAQK